MSEPLQWWCCQIGRREHYAVPRALRLAGERAALVTNFWAGRGDPAGAAIARLVPRWRASCHPGLADGVAAFSAAALAFEIRHRRGRDTLPVAQARNTWFERRAVRWMAAQPRRPDVVFAYSYAARGILRWARDHGIPTVLGQIDPGPAEERIVQALPGEDTPAAPAGYWVRWREEVALADAIVVNSAWSAEALVREGVPAAKIRTIPLAYEAAGPAAARSHPAQFTAERPLRVLFLGQVIARKGVGELLAAARRLQGQPVQFDFVGNGDARWIAAVAAAPNCRYHGHAAGAAVGGCYAAADLLLLPTHSDGFALTQLEALAHGLPVIASRYCAAVVEPGLNGEVLAEVSADAIAGALEAVLHEPARLAAWAAAARVRGEFGLAEVGQRWRALGRELAGGRREVAP